MFWIVLAGLAFAVLLYVRFAPLHAERWHVDPLVSGAAGGRSNQARVLPPGAGAADIESPVFTQSPEQLAARLDDVALAEPRTRRIGGRPEELRMTYVQRSAVFGFPDAVSVRVVPAEGGAALAIWSRARFGHSDMGVNRARVERWLEALR